MNRFIIPSSCISLSEQASYVAEYIYEETEEFKRIVSSIVFEESTEDNEFGFLDEFFAVNEANGNETFKEKLKALCDKISDAIKQLFDKTISVVTGQEAAAKKLAGLTVEKIKQLPDNVSFGKSHEFELDEWDFGQNALDLTDKVANEFCKYVLSEASADKVKAARNNYNKAICSTVSEMPEVYNLTATKNALRDRLTGDEVAADKEYIIRNFKEFSKVIFEGATSKRLVKEQHDAENAIIAIWRRADEITSKKFGPKKGDNNVALVAMVDLFSTILTVMNSCYMIDIEVSKRRFNEYKLIISKVARKCGTVNEEATLFGVNNLDDLFSTF